MLFGSRKKRVGFKKLTGLVVVVCYLFLVSSINLFHTCGRSHGADSEVLCPGEESCCIGEGSGQRVEKVSHHNGLGGCVACAFVISNQAAENSTLPSLFVIEAGVRQTIHETFLLSQDSPELLRGRGPPVSIL